MLTCRTTYCNLRGSHFFSLVDYGNLRGSHLFSLVDNCNLRGGRLFSSLDYCHLRAGHFFSLVTILFFSTLFPACSACEPPPDFKRTTPRKGSLYKECYCK